MSDSRDCLITIPSGQFNSNEVSLFEPSAWRMLCAYIWAPLDLPELVIVEVHPDLQDGGPHGFQALQSGRQDIDLPAEKVTAVTITSSARVRLHADTPVAGDRVFRWIAMAHPGW
jgi:hypothetical protein